MNERFKTWYLYLTLFISGAVILIIEIFGTKVLAPFYGSTIFVWSSLITVTLSALALGYFIGGYFADLYPKRQKLYGIIFIAGFFTTLLIKLNEPVLIWTIQLGFQWGPLVATFILFFLPLFLFGMATPFVVRLRVLALEHTGHVSGTIFAIATAGSVTGAILTGFYLTSHFFVSTIFITMGVVVMGIAVLGLLLEGGRRKIILISVLLTVLAWATPSAVLKSDERVLYRAPSFYGDIWVVQRDGLRCLLVYSQGQSCIRMNQGGKQAFSYGDTIVNLLASREKKDSALVIGIAGGVIARDLESHFNAIDAVDVDSKIVAVARQFFNYPGESKVINTVIADGRQFLKQNTRQYDAIVLDAFSGINPASHLYTKEAFTELKGKLSPGGILIVNTYGYVFGKKAELQKSIAKTLRSVFPNFVAVSSKDLARDEEILDSVMFMTSADNASLSFGDGFLVRYTENELDKAFLLTDNYNPIEALVFPVIEESWRNHQGFLGHI